MPIEIDQGGLIPNRPAVNTTLRNNAQLVIDALAYPDLWRGPGTLHNGNGVRIDMQGRIPDPPAKSNIQVQTNGRNPLTVAHANVSDTIMTDDPANQTGAVRRVIAALRMSLADVHSYTVSGSIP